MQFKLPDGQLLSLPDGATGADAAAAIGAALARAALAVKVDGELLDLGRSLPTRDGDAMHVTAVSGAIPGLFRVCRMRRLDAGPDAASANPFKAEERCPMTHVALAPVLRDGPWDGT